jgi:hypothetical protein
VTCKVPNVENHCCSTFTASHEGVTERNGNGNGNLLLDGKLCQLMDHDRDMLHVYRLVLNAGGHGKCTVSVSPKGTEACGRLWSG